MLRAGVYSIGEAVADALRAVELLGRVYQGIMFVYAGQLYPPPSSYDPARSQYISDMILALLDEARYEHGYDLAVGVAGVDAYTQGLNFVFGQALLDYGVAVVYTPRLRPEFYGEPPNERLYLERLLKELMHEIGHALGLHHCSTPGCVMNFSNSIVEVDAKKPAYCRRCTSKLSTKGVGVHEHHILPY